MTTPSDSIDMQTTLIACHECDLLIDMPKQLGHKEKLYCPRCKHHLATGHKDAAGFIVAIGLAALVMLVIANTYDFISISASGQAASMTLPEAVVHLSDFGYVILGMVFYAFAVVFPAAYIGLLLLLALPMLSAKNMAKPSIVRIRDHQESPPAYRVWVAKITTQLLPWSMSDVFLIGVLVGLIKLIDLATVVLGIAFWAYICFVIGFTLVVSLVDTKRLWEWVHYDHS